MFWSRKMGDNSSPKQNESFKTYLGQKTPSLDHGSNTLIYIIISYKILIPKIQQIIIKKPPLSNSKIFHKNNHFTSETALSSIFYT